MFAGDVRLEYSFMVSANRSRAEKLVGRKLKPLCPEWGPSMSPFPPATLSLKNRFLKVIDEMYSIGKIVINIVMYGDR